ncbi:MAG TPA: hypothetical protein VKU41_10140 [Polyangiaceae bacterium]|nr:hypothetical protein [Polyangiaceae bacterium]
MSGLARYGGVLALVACAACAIGSAEQGAAGDSGAQKQPPSGQQDAGALATPAPGPTGTSSGPPPSPDTDGGSDTDAAVTDDAPPSNPGGGGSDAAAGGPDGFGIDWDALFAPPPPPASDASTSADGLSCANQGCFDIFDCALYHPAEFSACKYTQCVNLVCQ